MELAEARTVIPALIERIRTSGPRGRVQAIWIEDVYSEVLQGLRVGHLADEAWVDDLLHVCTAYLDVLENL